MTLRSMLYGLAAPALISISTAMATTAAPVAGAPPPSGLGETPGLGATMQLAAMNTAIGAAPAYFDARPSACGAVTPVLASEPGQILAGNFRDTDGNCYVWLNLRQSSTLTGSEICKTTLHEMGHLAGLEHSPDPADVMFSPFQAAPIPAPCVAPPAHPARVRCPAGASGRDYCEAIRPRRREARESPR